MTGHRLELLSLDETPIMEIANVDYYRQDKPLSGISEINLRLSKSTHDYKGEEIINPAFDILDSSLLLKVNDEEIYVISKPEEWAEGEKLYKEVIAYSREYELRKKLTHDLSGIDRVVYDPGARKDANGVHIGLLNYIEEVSDWRVTYTNKKVLNRKLDCSYEDITCLQLVQDLQKDFSCILKFYTLTKEIHVLDIDQVGDDRGIYLSDKNFISGLLKESNEDSIVTRLYVYGKDDVSIQSINITGKPYIDDFSYYQNEKYMSKSLLEALKKNQEYLEKYDDIWADLIRKMNKEQEETINALYDLEYEQAELNYLNKEFDLNIEDDDKREGILDEIRNQEKKIKEFQNIYDNKSEALNKTKKEIKALGDELSIENNLSEENLKELEKFIIEDKYVDNNYDEDSLIDLYQLAKDRIKTVSTPNISFEVDIEQFKTLTNEPNIKLYLGDLVHLEHSQMGQSFVVRVIGQEYIDGSYIYRFSSPNNIFDQVILIEDILADAQDVSKTVDYSKFKWDKAQTVDNDFRDYIQSELDLRNQSITKAKGQKPVLDDRGLWLYKENKDGSISPEQVRAVNNIIAITRDNWKTVEVALTPDGVMANQLIGDVILGTDLRIVSNKGVVEILENLLTIRDDKGRPRVQLGEYKEGVYGLRLTDKEGRNTVLDENGMLQVWQEGRADNVDKIHGLKLHIYLPINTRKVYKAQLRYSLEEFRSYSDTTDTESATYTSTGWDGSVYDTTGGGGAVYDTTGGGGGLNTTTFGGKDYDIEWFETWLSPYAGAERGGQWFRMVTGHNHEIITEDHHHSITIGEHHHSITIGGHDHSVTIPSHSHEILPIIKVHNQRINSCRVYINGTNRTYSIGGTTTLKGDQHDLDITDYLIKGQWNTIEIKADNLGRIDATVFIQALLNYE